ncbi:MAG: response regulator transcription factor [Lachnospiraceae bacterium]|nr:response regulator transcription factor [Lachnospiraceae bacterium]
MPIKVLLADDHSMIREGIRQLLELMGEIEVIGEAADGVECINLLKKVKPDILLLDINMPHMNGLQVLEKISRGKIPVKIIVLTVHNEVEYLMKSLDIGVDGYLLKDAGSAELKKAVFSVYNNVKYIQPELLPLLNQKLVEKESDLDKIHSLTKREMQILKLISEGLFNKEIGDRLNISERTVKNHVFNLFKKIGAADRTQAAVFAIRNNVVDVK